MYKNNKNADKSQEKWQQALREAVDWSIYLEDDPDNDEIKAQIKNWLQQDDINIKAWDKTAEASSLIYNSQQIKLFPTKSIKKPKNHFKTSIIAITSIAAAAFVSLYIAPQLFLYATAEYITNNSEQKIISLDDGSTIRLAPGSAATVSYNDNSRNVKLLKGEAFFEVEHNAARPFRVNANTTDVTVLGTGFDVRIGNASTEVGVNHGKVRVNKTNSGARFLLTNGNWVRLYDDGTTASGTIPQDLIGSWDSHRLSAINRPISEVVADLSRYYNGKIILANSNLGAKTVTGIFNTDNITETAQIITKPHNGKVTRITPWLLIIS